MNDISILGLGASGDAAARLALNKGAQVYVSDTRSDPATSARGADLRALGARVDLGAHDLDRVAASATVVVSPGIPPDAPVLRGLRARGVDWISELELAFRFLPGPLIAVTGTNGKTTTCALTAHLLEEAGVDVGLGGNIGAGLGPAASELALRDPAPAWFVLEVSSFQLADIDTFRPDIGVVTNLAPDHLDRYPDVETYWADKARLFDNADADCRWVLNADDPAVLELARDVPGERRHFSVEGTDVEGAALDEGVLRLTGDAASSSERNEGPGAGTGHRAPFPPERRIDLLPRAELPLLGTHNVANALAAALAAGWAGVDPEALGRGLATARPLPHRLEPVAEGGHDKSQSD